VDGGEVGSVGQPPSAGVPAARAAGGAGGPEPTAAPRRGAEAEYSATEPDLDDEPIAIDYLAARIVNGRHRGVPVEETVDLPRIEAAVREILIAVGEDPDRDGLRQTPARVARAYAEMLAGLRVDPRQVLSTTFEANHDELVLVRDIEVTSLCEHHLLPFHGVAHIGYVPGPDGRITGLSKLARLVEAFARRPQVQERLTAQIADLLIERLNPRGVIVVLECEHMCMAMRGVQKAGARTVTSAVRGMLRDDAKSRAEAMSLIIRG
jgi:GTP cyclohydrolase IA